MAIRTYKVTLDSKNSIAPEPVFLRQGDKTGAVVIDVTLMDNGSPVSLSGLTPMFKANTADGQAVIADSTGFSIVDAPGGEFTYQVPSQLGSVDGKIKIAYFSFSDSFGAQSTFNIVFVVERAADMAQESAKDWVSNLNDIINQYNQWVNNAHSSWQYFVNANKEIIESIDPGGTLLTEVINARTPSYTTLGERLNDMPTNEDLSDLEGIQRVNIDVDGGVKEPFLTAIDDFKNTINSDTGVLKIALNQDLHFMRPVNDPNYREATNRGLVHIQHMGRLSSAIDLVVYNGDTVHGRETKSATVNRIKQVINTHRLGFEDVPAIWTIGNHDDNNVYFSGPNKIDNTLTLSELEDVFEIEKTYKYQDFDKQKVRVIVLNVFENQEKYNKDGSIMYSRDYSSVLSAEQLNWLANDALNAPANYHVIVFQHCPPEGFGGNKPYPNYRNVNHDVLINILNAFIAGGKLSISGTNSDYPVTINADFSTRGKGVLIGLVCGHEHHDLPLEKQGEIRMIERTCNLPAGRTLGTVQEEAFDVIEIDTANRLCKFNRFGTGSPLEFSY